MSEGLRELFTINVARGSQPDRRVPHHECLALECAPFGLKDIKELSAKREDVLKWLNEYSPMALAKKDAPPIGLFYGGDKDAKVGGIHKDPTHSPVMGMKLAEKLKTLNVEVVLSYTGHPDSRYANASAFLIEHLRK